MPIKITTLTENTASATHVLAEWGLCMLIEADNHKILLDSGQTFSAVHNAIALGIDLSQIDTIVLSHGHLDHTGGLLHILEMIKKQVQIVAHPDIWNAKYAKRAEEKEKYIGVPFPREAADSLGATFNLTKEPVWLTPNIVTSGEIPMITEYEEIDPELYVKKQGTLRPDPLWDDQAIFVKSRKGLVIILGCAHRGIINTVRHARKITGTESVYAIIGGTHLIRASPRRLKLTIAELRSFGLRRLGVSHCTGLAACTALAQTFGEAFLFNNAGTSISL